jgi:hypothetical protein
MTLSRRPLSRVVAQKFNLLQGLPLRLQVRLHIKNFFRTAMR